MMASVSSCVSHTDGLIVLRAQGNAAGEHLSLDTGTRRHARVDRLFCFSFASFAAVVLAGAGSAASYSLVGCDAFKHLRCSFDMNFRGILIVVVVDDDDDDDDCDDFWFC